MKVNGVFEGGGVKGISLVGAVRAAELNGIRFHHVAGTSSGSIIASLWLPDIRRRRSSC